MDVEQQLFLGDNLSFLASLVGRCLNYVRVKRPMFDDAEKFHRVQIGLWSVGIAGKLGIK